MGLFDFLWRLLFGASRPPSTDPVDEAPSALRGETTAQSTESQSAGHRSSSPPASRPEKSRKQRSRKRIQLEPLEYQPSLVATDPRQELVKRRPYRFSSAGIIPSSFLDLSQDSDPRWLEYYGLPRLKTPEELASWLGIPIGRLAWLTHHTQPNHRAESEKKSHYVYRWLPKRSGGWRLIEAPKPELKRVQEKILREILNHVPTHNAAHGFVIGRSIISNSMPHTGKRFLLKLDLKDFYANVRYSRVVAIFRSLGYSREVAIWLARLTTTALPWDVKSPVSAVERARFSPRHLPQGGVTSPALANLSAFSLDVRLQGVAERYHLTYTRYADDLTFSGSGRVIPALNEIVPLIRQIVASERFYLNSKKCRVIRNGQRQVVTGIVVNERLNVPRVEYDRLKAILHNCIKHGPSTQNRENHPHFYEHLMGRIAHVLHVNPNKGAKLVDLFHEIQWNR